MQNALHLFQKEHSVAVSTISVRIPAELRESSRIALKNNDLSITEYIRDCLEYLVQTGRPAVRKQLIAGSALDDDSDIIKLAKQRRAQKPMRTVSVKLDD